MAEQGDDDDRTEEPSARRLEQAIERGDVAKSTEVVTFFLLGATTLAILFSAGPASLSLALSLKTFLGNAHQMPIDAQGLRMVANYAAMAGIAAVGLPMLFLIIAGIGSNMIQHSLVWSTESLAPKLSRISIMSGAKRVFGKEALVQFLKGLSKMSVVAVAVTIALYPERRKLISFIDLDPAAVLPEVLVLILKLLGATLGIFAFIAATDYGYQRMKWYKRQRMTKQEVKDEHKEQEGNPEIKQKIKQLRNRAARKRMMAAVPKATVVITNPTHFAVALRYEQGMNAPICLAKGLDAVALKIREIAEGHDVPVIENKPLARALHATVEIDGEIPAEHYKAVAEVIGYVMRFRKQRI